MSTSCCAAWRKGASSGCAAGLAGYFRNQPFPVLARLVGADAPWEGFAPFHRFSRLPPSPHQIGQTENCRGQLQKWSDHCAKHKYDDHNTNNCINNNKTGYTIWKLRNQSRLSLSAGKCHTWFLFDRLLLPGLTFGCTAGTCTLLFKNLALPSLALRFPVFCQHCLVYV